MIIIYLMYDTILGFVAAIFVNNVYLLSQISIGETLISKHFREYVHLAYNFQNHFHFASL